MLCTLFWASDQVTRLLLTMSLSVQPDTSVSGATQAAQVRSNPLLACIAHLWLPPFRAGLGLSCPVLLHPVSDVATVSCASVFHRTHSLACILVAFVFCHVMLLWHLLTSVRVFAATCAATRNTIGISRVKVKYPEPYQTTYRMVFSNNSPDPPRPSHVPAVTTSLSFPSDSTKLCGGGPYTILATIYKKDGCTPCADAFCLIWAPNKDGFYTDNCSTRYVPQEDDPSMRRQCAGARALA